MIKYYCPYCKKVFDHWNVGHVYYVSVCAGGCNTPKQEMYKLYKQRIKNKKYEK